MLPTSHIHICSISVSSTIHLCWSIHATIYLWPISIYPSIEPKHVQGYVDLRLSHLLEERHGQRFVRAKVMSWWIVAVRVGYKYWVMQYIGIMEKKLETTIYKGFKKGFGEYRQVGGAAVVVKQLSFRSHFAVFRFRCESHFPFLD